MKIKRTLTSLVAIAQIALLLVSSIGIAVDLHLCQNKVKTVGIFTAAPSCGMETSDDEPCPKHNDPTIENNCCSNTQFFVQQDVETNLQNSDINFPVVAMVLNQNETTVDPLDLVDNAAHCIPDPPPLVRDLQTLYDVFLI